MLEAEGHDNAMRSLTDEVLSDDALGTYLVASNTPTVSHASPSCIPWLGTVLALVDKPRCMDESSDLWERW